MYQKGDLALLGKKELVGGPWTSKGSIAMDTFYFPVEVVDVTYLGDEYQELSFVVKYLTGDRHEIVFSHNLYKLT